MKKSTKLQALRSVTNNQLTIVTGGANMIESLKTRLSVGDVATFVGAAAADAQSLGGMF